MSCLDESIFYRQSPEFSFSFSSSFLLDRLISKAVCRVHVISTSIMRIH